MTLPLRLRGIPISTQRERKTFGVCKAIATTRAYNRCNTRPLQPLNPVALSSRYNPPIGLQAKRSTTARKRTKVLHFTTARYGYNHGAIFPIPTLCVRSCPIPTLHLRLCESYSRMPTHTTTTRAPWHASCMPAHACPRLPTAQPQRAQPARAPAHRKPQ
jgi:hypothetical protein